MDGAGDEDEELEAPPEEPLLKSGDRLFYMSLPPEVEFLYAT